MSKATPSKSPAIDLNDKYDKADLLGTLIVVLLKARNLNDKHSFRKSDVFAQAILNGTQKRTHVDIKGGQHPEWDGETRFPILKSNTEKFRKMEVACYSMEPRSEDLMGKATVDISETLRTGEFDDWVQLEVDGVPRGELYLEMTYYASSPAPAPAVPNKLLLAVANQSTGLNRRPSKLPAAERLSRPQQHHNQPTNQAPTQQSRPQEYSRPTHSSRLSEGHHIHVHDDTPVMPGSYPYTPDNRAAHGFSTNETKEIPHEVSRLRPGAQGAHQQPPAAAALPTILRPGVGGASSSATPIPRPPNGQSHARQSSDSYLHTPSQASPPSHNPYLGGGGSSSASSSQSSSPPRNPYMSSYTAPSNPYIGTGTPLENQRQNTIVPPSGAGSAATPANAQSSYSGYRLGAQSRADAPPLWQQSNSSQPLSNNSFAFPTPSVTPAYIDNTGPVYNRRPSGPSAPQSMHNGYESRHAPIGDDRDFEPHLQTRYQSPLPLPPRSEQSPAAVAHAHNPTHTIQASPIYTKTPTPPPKTPTPALDQSRLKALRLAEEDAARRREQELQDLELAMQLDRELNLAEERAAGR
ncbi:hypothetical protein HYPSUDRAFT_159226 [Hypholoma sublateritium FD-334 SS-4]|uniref:C2 domain-containing protein n=1 Tax=Hypholoma sublateritium (strain FD-334 SS-4) TaxID=945553 RepID=A0A0D2PCJ2_HYPSF|nr:hypothetical protein HYPSUDRAFT_159226 [Hypholoma sublateritium FD-334 SS-4]